MSVTVDRPAEAAPLDMRHPAFREDPHPLLRALRDGGRVTRDVVGMWVLCHHADANAGLRSGALSREVWRLPVYRQLRPYLADSTLERTTEQWMLFNDPPKHTRLRRLAQAAFKPPVIAALRERITAITDALLDELPADGQFELIAGLAQPLPVRVICDVLGLPAVDFAQTKAWSDALALIIEPVSRQSQRVAANQAAEEMVAYLRGHIASCRASSGRDDLLSLLVAAQDGGAALSEDELLGNLILLFIAGHETTTNLIGNGMLALLRHPDELQRLRAQPGLITSAVDEMLRFEGSVNMVARHTITPYAVGDVVVPPEQVLYFMLGAANRDPAVFADPDRFDIARNPNPHLAFGAGIHYCLGAPLARLEAEIAFIRLLQRMPRLQRVDEVPRWRPLINLRGLESLRLRSEPAITKPTNEEFQHDRFRPHRQHQPGPPGQRHGVRQGHHRAHQAALRPATRSAAARRRQPAAHRLVNPLQRHGRDGGHPRQAGRRHGLLGTAGETFGRFPGRVDARRDLEDARLMPVATAPRRRAIRDERGFGHSVGHAELLPYFKRLEEAGREVILSGGAFPRHGMTFVCSVNRPRSQGTVTLASADRLDRPVIDPAYLSAPKT